MKLTVLDDAQNIAGMEYWAYPVDHSVPGTSAFAFNSTRPGTFPGLSSWNSSA
ncbi:MAG TPA: hypothetical protein VGK02_07675 [Candidatus Aquicultor sp.]